MPENEQLNNDEESKQSELSKLDELERKLEEKVAKTRKKDIKNEQKDAKLGKRHRIDQRSKKNDSDDD